MIEFNTAGLEALLTAFMGPFVRILAVIGSAPLLGESSIPAYTKIGCALALTLIVAPLQNPMDNPPAGSYAMLLVIAEQVVIGLAIGLTMRIVFAAVQTAGELIGLQMGLSFASFFDPATGANTAVLTRLMNTVALLLFIALDGHLILLASLVQSFEMLPIAVGASLSSQGFVALLEWSAHIVMTGLLLALPLVIILLTVSLAMGILNRTAQQLSVFAVGFPISLMTGLLLLTVVLPQSSSLLAQHFEQGYDAIARVLAGLAGQP